MKAVAPMWRFLGFGAALPALLAIASGCSSSGDVSARVAKLNDSNIKRVANLYGVYQLHHNQTGPGDESTFKQFIKSMPAEKLEMMQVDLNDLDGMFKSPRDGQPFKIRYGVVRRDPAFGPYCAVVFEETGVGGTRQVGITNASVEDADEARYKELWEGRGMEAPKVEGSESPIQSTPSG